MRKFIGAVVALAVLLGLVGAYVVIRPPSTTAPPKQVNEATSRPRTALEKVVDDINVNGLTKQRALRAFSLQHGPIEGVTVPTSDPGAGDQYFSGTLTTGWVQRFARELTDDERAAVRALLHEDGPGSPPDSPSGSGAGSSGSGSGRSGTGSGGTTPSTRRPGGSSNTESSRSTTTTEFPETSGTAQSGLRASNQSVQLAGNDTGKPNLQMPMLREINGRGLRADFKDLDYQAAADEMNNVLSTKLGAPPIGNLRIDSVVNPGGQELYGEARQWDESGRQLKDESGRDACIIQVFTDKTGSLSPGAMESVFAHEVFHCYQFRAAGSLAARNAVPPWVQEGEATWVMATLRPAGLEIGKVQAAWNRWVGDPQKALTDRDYDGVGFFAHIGHVTGGQESMWSRLLPAVQAGPGAYGSLVAGNAAVVERWGSSYYRESGRPLWDMEGPGLPLASGRSEPIPLPAVSAGLDVHLPPTLPFAAAQYAIPVQAEIVEVQGGSGRGRIGDLDLAFDAPLTGSTDQYLCFDGNECKCPPGTEGELPLFTQVRSGYLKVGMSGGALSASAVLIGYSVKDFCKEKKRKPKPGPGAPATRAGGPGQRGNGSQLGDAGCGTSCGGSNGDPHLTTLDGVHYSLQAVGEFTVVKSTNDSFEVQARQSAFPDSRDVSINSSVGVRVGNDRLTISTSEDGLTLRLNGEEKRIDEIVLRDAELKPQDTDSGTAYIVELRDGTRVYAIPIDADGINLQIALGNDRKGKVEGLLGNGNDDRTDDLVADNGRQLGEKPKDDDIYGALADRWRVRQDSSILDYPEGKNTDSFTDRSFPDTRILAKDVPNRDEAERVCRGKGVTDSGVLESCIIDVALTGSSGFAQAHQVDQNVVNQLKPQRQRTKGGTFADRIDDPNTDVSHTFDAEQDEVIFVGGDASSCQDSDMVFQLVDPDGQKVRAQTGCQFGRIQLPKSGKYTMYANATHEHTGEYEVPLVPVRPDVVRDVKVGDELSGRIENPAEHDVFKVQSNGGNQTIHASQDGCDDSSMLFDVIAPSGSSAGSAPGCLLENIPMYDTGTYLIVVNARENGTGDYRVRIEAG